ncbi:MAG: InlB B-repeat-containing protein [Candidatus Aenigmatarchaeota archaeon]
MVGGMGEDEDRSCNISSSVVIYVIIFFLLSSPFLPSYTTGEEALSDNTQDCGVKSSMEGIKRIEDEGIWHVEERDPSEGPFGTNTTTLSLELTAYGEEMIRVQPFDWVFCMDSSGSMDWSDPNDQRIAGAQRFVDLVEENASGSRGATIDFDSSAHLVNDRHLTDDYDAIKSDLDTIDANGGTEYAPPLDLALDEFQNHGNTSRPWFNLFLTDGESESGGFWDLVDEHADLGIPIYTIGFGEADKDTLNEMAIRTGGEYNFAEDAEDLEDVFESIYEEIARKDRTAVLSPPDEPMVREVLPSHLEYVEGSADPQDNFTVREENENTILEWDREKMDVNETWELKYDIRANEYAHDLPITAYDGGGDALSRVAYENISSEEIEVVPMEGPKLDVHGRPQPVIGASRWEKVMVGETVTFKNMTWDGEEKSDWPGDCEIDRYQWELGDGTEKENSTIEHIYDAPGTYRVDLTATTLCNASETVQENITVHPEDSFIFEVEIIDHDQEVVEGEEVSIDYRVTNTGYDEETQNIEFEVDGAVEDSLDITLEGDEEYEGNFTWRTEIGDAGSHQLAVKSEDDREERSVTVLEEYVLTVMVEGEGTVEVDPEKEKYVDGAEVELQAVPVEGWTLSRWTGDMEKERDLEEITIIMDEDKQLTAHFVKEYELTIDVKGEGTTEPEPGVHTFSEGEEVALEALPEEGWIFEGWTGDQQSSEDSITITMDANRSITAHFETNEHELTIDVEGEGTTDPEPGTHTYKEGAEVVIWAFPDEGWYLERWSGDHQGPGERITITMDGDEQVTAHFDELLEVIIEVEGNGTTDPEPGTHFYQPGEEAVIEARPDPGWEFDQWQGLENNEDHSEEIRVMIDEEKDITANFERTEPETESELNDDTLEEKDYGVSTISRWWLLLPLLGILMSIILGEWMERKRRKNRDRGL